MRAFVGLVTRLFYPLQVRGRGNFPRQGGVLLVSNHVSYADWVFIAAAARRPVRFLIGKEFYDSPWLNPFVRVARVIPVPSAIRPREVVEALERCAEAVRQGEVVCLFAEGGITRTGALQPFERGLERIMEHADAPIVPAALQGVWGSVFSFADGKAFWKWPSRFRRPITVSFGPPLSSSATALEVHAAVEKLLADDRGRISG